MDWNQAILGFILSDINIKNNSKKNTKKIWKLTLMTPLNFITRIFIYVMLIPASQDIKIYMLIIIIGVELFSTGMYFSLFLFQRRRLKQFHIIAKLLNSLCMLGFAVSSLFNIVVTNDRKSSLWNFSFYLLLISISLEYFLSAVLMLSKLITGLSMLIQGQKFSAPIRKIIFYKRPGINSLKEKADEIESRMPIHDTDRKRRPKVSVYTEAEDQKRMSIFGNTKKTIRKSSFGKGKEKYKNKMKMRRMKIADQSSHNKPKKDNSNKVETLNKKKRPFLNLDKTTLVKRFSIRDSSSPNSLNSSFNSRTP